MNTLRGNHISTRQWGWLLPLAGGLFFLLFLDNRDFWESHQESRRVVPALEIIRDGNWLSPTLNGAPFITKPPFYYWMMAGTFTLAGYASEWLARLPSVIAAVISLWFTFQIGLRLWNRRVAIYAAIICATSGLYYHQARLAELDMTLTACVAGTLYCLVAWRETGQGKYRIGFALAAGLTTLIKGPVGLVFPVAAMLGTLAHTRSAAGLPRGAWWWLAGGVAAILGPWLVAVMAATPEASGIFTHEIQNNFTTTGYSRQPVWFYLGSVLLFAPWVAFLPGALWRSWKTFNKQEWVIWYWIVGAVIVFSLVGQKKDYYLLPLYPALSLLVAWWWDSRRAAVGDRSWAIPYRLLLGILGGAAVVFPFFSHLTQVPASAALLLSVPLASIVAFGWLRGTTPEKKLGTLAVAFGIIALSMAIIAMPRWNALRTHQPFFARISGAIGQQDLVFYKMHTFEGNFYLQKNIPELLEADTLIAYAATPGRFIICHPAMIAELHSVIAAREIDRNVRPSTRPPHHLKGLVLVETLPAPTNNVNENQ